MSERIKFNFFSSLGIELTQIILADVVNTKGKNAFLMFLIKQVPTIYKSVLV